jgi:hypothetical protein
MEDLAKFLEKAASKTNGNDHFLTMNLCEEHESCQLISMMLTFIIDSTPTSHICTFCRDPKHIIKNYPYKFNQIPIFVTKPIFSTTQLAILVSS